MTFSKYVRETRQQLGLSQVRLSGLSGVSLPTIQNIESEKANPSLSIMEALGAALGLTLNVSPLGADWNLISSLGGPILSHGDPYKGEIDSEKLLRHLRLALLEIISNSDAPQTERKEEVIYALLWAIKSHFPSFFGKHLERVPLVKDLLRVSPNGRHLKLKRFAEAQLAKYL